MRIYDTLIIGAGPCGIRSGIILKEAGLDVAVFEYSTPGGKINIAPRVDNYPGFTKIPGPDLAVEFFNWFNKAGVEMIPEEVTSLTKVDDVFHILTAHGEYLAKTVLIATGTKEKQLGIPNEERLFGHGVSRSYKNTQRYPHSQVLRNSVFFPNFATISGVFIQLWNEGFFMSGRRRSFWSSGSRRDFFRTAPSTMRLGIKNLSSTPMMWTCKTSRK